MPKLEDYAQVELANKIKIIRGMLITIDKNILADAIDMIRDDYSKYEAIGILDGYSYLDKVEQKKNQYKFMKALQALHEANGSITKGV